MIPGISQWQLFEGLLVAKLIAIRYGVEDSQMQNNTKGSAFVLSRSSSSLQVKVVAK